MSKKKQILFLVNFEVIMSTQGPPKTPEQIELEKKMAEYRERVADDERDENEVKDDEFEDVPIPEGKKVEEKKAAVETKTVQVRTQPPIQRPEMKAKAVPEQDNEGWEDEPSPKTAAPAVSPSTTAPAAAASSAPSAAPRKKLSAERMANLELAREMGDAAVRPLEGEDLKKLIEEKMGYLAFKKNLANLRRFGDEKDVKEAQSFENKLNEMSEFLQEQLKGSTQKQFDEYFIKNSDVLFTLDTMNLAILKIVQNRAAQERATRTSPLATTSGVPAETKENKPSEVPAAPPMDAEGTPQAPASASTTTAAGGAPASDVPEAPPMDVPPPTKEQVVSMLEKIFGLENWQKIIDNARKNAPADQQEYVNNLEKEIQAILADRLKDSESYTLEENEEYFEKLKQEDEGGYYQNLRNSFTHVKDNWGAMPTTPAAATVTGGTPAASAATSTGIPEAPPMAPTKEQVISELEKIFEIEGWKVIIENARKNAMIDQYQVLQLETNIKELLEKYQKESVGKSLTEIQEIYGKMKVVELRERFINLKDNFEHIRKQVQTPAAPSSTAAPPGTSASATAESKTDTKLGSSSAAAAPPIGTETATATAAESKADEQQEKAAARREGEHKRRGIPNEDIILLLVNAINMPDWKEVIENANKNASADKKYIADVAQEFKDIIEGYLDYATKTGLSLDSIKEHLPTYLGKNNQYLGELRERYQYIKDTWAKPPIASSTSSASATSTASTATSTSPPAAGASAIDRKETKETKADEILVIAERLADEILKDKLGENYTKELKALEEKIKSDNPNSGKLNTLIGNIEKYKNDIRGLYLVYKNEVPRLTEEGFKKIFDEWLVDNFIEIRDGLQNSKAILNDLNSLAPTATAAAATGSTTTTAGTGAPATSTTASPSTAPALNTWLEQNLNLSAMRTFYNDTWKNNAKLSDDTRSKITQFAGDINRLINKLSSHFKAHGNVALLGDLKTDRDNLLKRFNDLKILAESKMNPVSPASSPSSTAAGASTASGAGASASTLVSTVSDEATSGPERKHDEEKAKEEQKENEEAKAKSEGDRKRATTYAAASTPPGSTSTSASASASGTAASTGSTEGTISARARAEWLAQKIPSLKVFNEFYDSINLADISPENGGVLTRFRTKMTELQAALEQHYLTRKDEDLPKELSEKLSNVGAEFNSIKQLILHEKRISEVKKIIEEAVGLKDWQRIIAEAKRRDPSVAENAGKLEQEINKWLEDQANLSVNSSDAENKKAYEDVRNRNPEFFNKDYPSSWANQLSKLATPSVTATASSATSTTASPSTEPPSGATLDKTPDGRTPQDVQKIIADAVGLGDWKQIIEDGIRFGILNMHRVGKLETPISKWLKTQQTDSMGYNAQQITDHYKGFKDDETIKFWCTQLSQIKERIEAIRAMTAGGAGPTTDRAAPSASASTGRPPDLKDRKAAAAAAAAAREAGVGTLHQRDAVASAQPQLGGTSTSGVTDALLKESFEPINYALTQPDKTRRDLLYKNADFHGPGPHTAHNFTIKNGDDIINRQVTGGTEHNRSIKASISGNATNESLDLFCQMNNKFPLKMKPCNNPEKAVRVLEAAKRTGAKISLDDKDIDAIMTRGSEELKKRYADVTSAGPEPTTPRMSI